MNKKLIILLVLALLALMAWAVLFLLPHQARKSALSQEFHDLKARQARQVSVLDVQRLRAETDSLEAGLKERMIRIYKGKQLLDLGRVMERIGNKYGLRLVSIAPDYGSLSIFRESAQISSLPIQMKYEGSFKSLTEFLDDFHDFPFFVDIESLSVKRLDLTQRFLSIDIKGIIVINNEQEGETNTALAVTSGTGR